jgi:carbon monoxide dehydrogenase subunit G
MRVVKAKRQIGASPDKVWAVLADFPNIAEWNSGVNRSYATSDATAGVGAKRHCDLAPMGALEETVTGWDEEKRMEIKIDSAARLPITHGHATLTLSGADTATDVSVEYSYQPKFGFLGHLMGRFMLDGQFTKGFTSFLKDLEQASRKA